MRWWDNLRTALDLANRVEECESQLQEVLSEWTDVQDKLLAREERLRKRLSRELKSSLVSESPPEQPSTQSSPTAAPSEAHKRIRAQWERQRASQ